ncbi:lysine--tRNA ligase [Paenibacillus glucanolyticus]|uniref:lysine--tRNA ligase n=1 Tax=Paenibacillus glucanolyticus TaxID=59843 RepID=UPI00096E8CFC|nr:lysine--tRNA ligase [Paenibacillus glucanolyticus]OMF70793.1 lysine--tRNA ligase [Paenibacillus glucanolyticus]
MHWSERIANELIERYPDRQTYVCAAGISPSGAVHIGNFREIVTAYFVTKALRKQGRKVRFIFSWDDFDRFRKVPAGVDPGFEQYIGMPYVEVPCPFGCHASYAEHYEKEFELALAEFGIEPEFIYQSREYQSRRYNSLMLHAIRHRTEIYDILHAFKTGGAHDQERAVYYPVQVYCEECRRDTTTIQQFDEQTERLGYACICGHRGTLSILQATHMKLQWKIDWPMRWKMENVAFEPGGRDHSSETGSYNVSKVISENIFGNPAPSYAAYEFISMKGSHAKMSSSSGSNYTPGDLLKVYAPENILFMFAKYQPNAPFHIGLDEDVIRNYTEYERYRNPAASKELSPDIEAALELSMPDSHPGRAPKFSQLSGILPLVNFDYRLLQELLHRVGESYAKEQLEPTARRAEYWIKHWYPQKLITVKEHPDHQRYETLDSLERQWLHTVCDLLKDAELTGSTRMEKIYAICHHDDKKMMKQNQKRLFSLIYQLVLGRDEGPRIPILIEGVGVHRMLDLLNFQK